MKSLTELIRAYRERQAHAERTQATAPLAATYALIIEELEQLAPHDAGDDVTTAEAADLLGMAQPTIARKCGAGEFPNAWKTSGESGDWRIPRSDVDAYRRREGGSNRSASEPWEL